MAFIYVIEHMEEDEATARSIPPWVELEYAHMRILAGAGAQVHFTHLSSASCTTLASTSQNMERARADRATATFHETGVLDLMKRLGVSLDQVCLLDPKAEKQLTPVDGDLFSWFLFGGILGDDPPRDRTSELRALGFPGRHLGSVQMTTDTALGVTKRVVKDNMNLEDIPYIDFPTVRFNAKESVEMPFRYIKQSSTSGPDQPLLPPGMRELLHEDLNKSFEF